MAGSSLYVVESRVAKIWNKDTCVRGVLGLAEPIGGLVILRGGGGGVRA
jgi:hypothetical protein